MSQSNFYAMLSRMKYINRWGLMNNTRYENISEHSQQVAVLAHCLVLIHNKRFGGSLNPERAALLAVFHDATEIITGDMPTRIQRYPQAVRQRRRRAQGLCQGGGQVLGADKMHRRDAHGQRRVQKGKGNHRAVYPRYEAARGGGF